MTSLTKLCLYNLALQDYELLKESNIPIELKEQIEEISCVVKKCIKDSTEYFKYIREYPDLILYLMKKNLLNPNDVNNEGETALHLAAKSGNLVLVRYLIENRHLYPTAITNVGFTVLNYADMSDNNIEIIRRYLYLITPNLIDFRSVLYYAVMDKNCNILRDFLNWENGI